MRDFYNVSRHTLKELRKVSTLGIAFSNLIKQKHYLDIDPRYMDQLSDLHSLTDLLASLVPSTTEEYDYLGNILCDEVSYIIISPENFWNTFAPQQYIQLLIDMGGNIIGMLVPERICKIECWVKRDA